MLRPTFLSFETARRALTASQLGLDTVGHNISNVNTPGYTRQRVDQVSISSSGYKTKYQAFGVQFPGQGSQVTGITQIRDPFLDKRFRDEASGAGELSTISEGLSNINAIFDEIKTSGSHKKLSEFITSLENLSAKADTKELQTVLRNKAKEVAQVLNANYKDLEAVTEQTTGELKYSIDDANNILEQIAMLNLKIKEDNFYGNPANELNDQRNLLIDQLAELVPIEVKRTPVKISGDVTIQQLSIELKGSGIELLHSGQYNGFALDTKNDGTVSISLIDGISGLPVVDPKRGTDDVTDKIHTGALKGHVAVLNGKGIHAGMGESSFRGLPYYKQALDDYAQKFADVLNTLNSVKVYDGSGNVVSTIPMPLFAANDGTGVITAKNIALSDQYAKNEGYINKTTLNGGLRVTGAGWLQTNTDPPVSTGIRGTDVKGVDEEGYLLDAAGNRLPGASGNGYTIDGLRRADSTGTAIPNGKLPGADAADNINAMKLALLGANRFGNGFVGSFQEYLVSYSADMGLDQNINDAMLDATLSVLNGLADSRDAVSAVSIDEEGINMMTFQNYYNAAARYMTVLDEALGTIIQGMGVVGR